MQQTTKVKLNPRRVELIVQELNKVLDTEKVYGTEWNIEVLLELIKSNLYKDGVEDLIARINAKLDEWDN